nr:unnamed protein product [Digitaria exilis]
MRPFSLQSGHRRNSPTSRVVLDEDLAASVARIARHEPYVAAGGARLHVPELARRRGVAVLQGAPELAGLVQVVHVLRAADVLPVDEHPRQRRGAGESQELGELGLEDAVHGDVALVDAHAVAPQDAAHGAAYTTAFLSPPGGDRGDTLASRPLMLRLRSIFSWNALMRARTMPESSGMLPAAAGDIGTPHSSASFVSFFLGVSFSVDEISVGFDGGVSSRASRNPERISGSKSKATGGMSSMSPCIHSGRVGGASSMAHS